MVIGKSFYAIVKRGDSLIAHFLVNAQNIIDNTLAAYKIGAELIFVAITDVVYFRLVSFVIAQILAVGTYRGLLQLNLVFAVTIHAPIAIIKLLIE